MIKSLDYHRIKLRKGKLGAHFEIFIFPECYSVKFGLDISDRYYGENFDGIVGQVEAISLGWGML